MKKLFLALLVLVALFGITTLEQWFLMTPAARAQTNTFCAANLACTVTGAWTFTGAANVKTFETIVYVDSANNQGWAGSDLGGWINSAVATCPSTGCGIVIAAGSYSLATPISITKPASIFCPAGPDATVLTWTPATGIMLTFATNNQSAGFDGCFLKTSTSTTSLAMKVAYVNQMVINRFHINGFHGGIWVTGDGISTHSLGVRISNYLIDGNTTTANSFGIALDHAQDIYLNNFEWYSTNADVNAVGLIVDYNVGGLYMAGGSGTFEGGKNSMVVQQTNQIGALGLYGTGGGTYGGTPGAIFPSGVTFDNSTGGPGILFDASLGANAVRFYASSSWVRYAGRNGGACVTANTIGVDIEGGADINFYGGNITGNCGWGYKNNSTGANYAIANVTVNGNNQSNTAGQGGMLFTANPTNWRVVGVSSRNDAVDGGNQAYGLDISAPASTTGVIAGNDFRNNATSPIKMPAGLGNIGADAAYFGSGAGSNIIGPINVIEETAPGAVAAAEVLYGDGTSHRLSHKDNAVATAFIVADTVRADTLRETLHISDQGAVCTNGELVLSAGWGTTATVTTVVGIGQTCEWTLTSSGTGQAASPTITDTLTNTLPTATTVCEMRMVGGSGTATLIDQTTLSATAPVFTFLGTPVAAATYKVLRRCGP